MQLDRILSRRRNVPPENAHGQRNIDGSYFSVWLCQNGHGTVADTGAPPKREQCMKCQMDLWTSAPGEEPGPAEWRLASPEEAHAFIFDVEGPDMYDGIGFRLL